MATENTIKPFELIAITNYPHLVTNTGNSVFVYPPKSDNLTQYWSPGVYRHNGGIIYNIDWLEGTYGEIVRNIGGYTYPVVGGIQRVLDVDDENFYYASTLKFEQLSGQILQFGTLEFWSYIQLENIVEDPFPIFSFGGSKVIIDGEEQVIDQLALYLGGTNGWAINYSSYHTSPNEYLVIQNQNPLNLSNSWVHTAFSFTGTYIIMYINGQAVARIEQNIFGSNLFNSLMFLLWNDPQIQVTNYLTNVRLSNFVRYTGEFSPSLTEPYTISETETLPVADNGEPTSPEDEGLPSVDINASTVYLVPVAYKFDSYQYYGSDDQAYTSFIEFDTSKLEDINSMKDDDNEKFCLYRQGYQSSTLNPQLKIIFNNHLIENENNLEILNKYTFECLLKPRFTKNTTTPILSIRIGQSNQYEPVFNFYIGNEDIEINITTENSENSTVSTDMVYDSTGNEFYNQWVHIALVYDKDTCALLFVNGVNVWKRESSSFDFKPRQFYIIPYYSHYSDDRIYISNIRFSKGIRYNTNFTSEVWNKQFTAKHNYTGNV